MLVSVVVVTYNSSQYVLETLESIYKQDYQDIELIISDDCSKDDTRTVCERWLTSHADRFTRARFTQTPRNLGICGNYNHALKLVNGSWIKYIAGDDILYPECISTLVSIVSKSDRKLFYGAVTPFSIIDGKFVEKETRDAGRDCYTTDDPKEQFKRIEEKIFFVCEGPSIFIETETFRKYGGMDERYPMCEDFPLALKYTYNGELIGFYNIPVVYYREYPESVSNSDKKFLPMVMQAINDYRMKIAIDNHNYLQWWHIKVFSIIDKHQRLGNSCTIKLAKLLMLLDPISIKNRINHVNTLSTK